MYPYNPKPIHAMLSAFIVIVLLALKGNAKSNSDVQLALNIGALIFAIITGVIMFMLVMETLDRRAQVMIDFANAIAKLDDEARAMLAFEFPTLQYRMKRGEVRAYFEDTNVPIETFRLFLQTSNAKYISPRRDWFTAEQPEWAWVEIYTWLVEHKKVVADSAAGNVSYLWIGGSYQQLCAYWMAGRQMTDYGVEPIFSESSPSPTE